MRIASRPGALDGLRYLSGVQSQAPALPYEEGDESLIVVVNDVVSHPRKNMYREHCCLSPTVELGGEAALDGHFGLVRCLSSNRAAVCMKMDQECLLGSRSACWVTGGDREKSVTFATHSRLWCCACCVRASFLVSRDGYSRVRSAA